MHFLEIVFCDCSMFGFCGHGVAFILFVANLQNQ